jgi:hypothetical protein
MTFVIIWFIVWYTKPSGCMDHWLNERTRCSITFPDQSSSAYDLCITLADDQFYRCLRGEPYQTTPGPENP